MSASLPFTPCGLGSTVSVGHGGGHGAGSWRPYRSPRSRGLVWASGMDGDIAYAQTGTGM